MNPVEFDHRVWGGLALRGFLAILFGVLALSRPGATVTGLVYVFGLYAFLDGIAAFAASVNVAQLGGHWGAMFLVGMAGVVIGVLTFMNPSATALGLIYYLAAWALLTGVLEIAAAVRLRNVIDGEWRLVVAGALSILFGVLIAGRPGAGWLSLIWVIGIYAILFGSLMLGLAFRMRGVAKRVVTT
jgi:uncharacterized membrane protein HdeD (DUF308 family)